MEQYRANIVELVQIIKGVDGKQNPHVHVIIIGPPQCDSVTWGERQGGRERAAAFSARSWLAERFTIAPLPSFHAGLVSQQRHKLATPPVTRDNAHTLLYADAAKAVAEQFQLPYVHAWGFTSDWRASLCDGLHFTPKANHKLMKGTAKQSKDPVCRLPSPSPSLAAISVCALCLLQSFCSSSSSITRICSQRS